MKTTIKTNKMIVYLWDLETGKPRRLMFANPEEVYSFFEEQTNEMWKRVRAVAGKHSSTKKLNKAMEDSKPEYITDNDHGAYGEGYYIEFSYEIKKK